MNLTVSTASRVGRKGIGFLLGEIRENRYRRQGLTHRNYVFDLYGEGLPVHGQSFIPPMIILFMMTDYDKICDFGNLYKAHTGLFRFVVIIPKGHSCASLLINQNCSLKEVQEWMGHSEISVTADIYGHLETSRKVGMAAKMSNCISG